MRRIHRLLLALAVGASLGYAIAQPSAPSSGFAITDSTLTPMQTLSGGAFVLESHVGQPVTGTTGAGAFQLKGGFTPTDITRIFANGFEP
jgi:hypothetical protein